MLFLLSKKKLLVVDYLCFEIFPYFLAVYGAPFFLINFFIGFFLFVLFFQLSIHLYYFTSKFCYLYNVFDLHFFTHNINDFLNWKKRSTWFFIFTFLLENFNSKLFLFAFIKWHSFNPFFKGVYRSKKKSSSKFKLNKFLIDLNH